MFFLLCFLFSPSKHINKLLLLSFHSFVFKSYVQQSHITNTATLKKFGSILQFINLFRERKKNCETNEHQKEESALTAANTNNNTHSQIYRTTTNIKTTTIQPKRMNSNKKNVAAVRIIHGKLRRERQIKNNTHAMNLLRKIRMAVLVTPQNF